MQSMARRPLPAVPLLAYVAPSHDWAREQRRAITVDELVNQNLILLPGEHATRTVLDMAVTRGGLAYRNVEECAEPQVIQCSVGTPATTRPHLSKVSSSGLRRSQQTAPMHGYMATLGRPVRLDPSTSVPCLTHPRCAQTEG